MNLGRHQMKPLYLHSRGTSPEVQWLRLRVPNTEHRGCIPGWGTKVRMPSSASKEHKKQANRACIISQLSKEKQTRSMKRSQKAGQNGRCMFNAMLKLM